MLLPSTLITLATICGASFGLAIGRHGSSALSKAMLALSAIALAISATLATAFRASLDPVSALYVAFAAPVALVVAFVLALANSTPVDTSFKDESRVVLISAYAGMVGAVSGGIYYVTMAAIEYAVLGVLMPFLAQTAFVFALVIGVLIFALIMVVSGEGEKLMQRKAD